MNSKEQKLVSLLQPRDYKSKIKLYCLDSKFNVQKFGKLKSITYFRMIDIVEKG